jgi:predicted RNA-binding Zn ribbon-like protein
MPFGSHDFVADALCLDFVNTVGGHREGEPKETLNTYGDLLDWAVAADVLTKSAAVHLREAARENEARAARALTEAKRLRETIYEVFVALADERRPAASDVAALNVAMSEAFRHLQVKPSHAGYELGWPAPGGDLQAPLWPVIKSAADLLVSDETDHLRECAGETCGWLFLDLSKNKSRKWCDMKGCGNRAKIRRFRGASA